MGQQTTQQQLLEQGHVVRQIQRIDGEHAGRIDLTYYKRVGDVIGQVELHAYGAGHLTAVADALERIGVAGLGHNTLNKARKFSHTFSGSQVAILAEAAISWRRAISLMSKHVTERQRNEVIRDLQAGRLTSDEFDARIRRTRSTRAVLTMRSVQTAEAPALDAVKQLSRLRNRTAESSKYAVIHTAAQSALDSVATAAGPASAFG